MSQDSEIGNSNHLIKSMKMLCKKLVMMIIFKFLFRIEVKDPCKFQVEETEKVIAQAFKRVNKLDNLLIANLKKWKVKITSTVSETQ